MFTLGHSHIGKYIVWITTPAFEKTGHHSPDVLELPYFDVKVTRTEWWKNSEGVDKFTIIYLDLLKSEEFKFLFSLDKRNYPTDETDEKEFSSYLERKDMSQPLWKLSKKNVERLLAKCAELEGVSL